MRIAVILLAAGLASAAQLQIQVTGERGQKIWTRLEVHSPDGKLLQAEGAILNARPGSPHRSPYLGSFVVEGECRMEVAPGRYRVVAEHGTEYERVEREVDVASDTKVAIRLRPWIRMRERGWWSGDMHIHRPPDQAPALILAEDLNVGVVFTMWNRQNLWAGKPWPEPVQQLDANHLLTLRNAEDERGGGAWMLHGLSEALGLEKALGPDQRTTESWTPPGIDFVRAARRQRQPGSRFPWFDLEKPIWWEAPVMMALEPPDSIGMLHNHFNQYGMLANEAWARVRDTGRYPGFRGFADYTLMLNYRYWNLGFRVPPSAGAASGVLPNPVGYNRMYVKLDGALDLDKWYDGVRQGRLFLTNGPMLFWEPRTADGRLEGSIEVVAREPIERVEIVANGAVVWKQSFAKESTRYRGQFRFDADRYSWAAARCFVRAGDTVRMAHTAPLYLPGKWDASADARYFIEWIDDLIAKHPEQAELYRRARAVYERK